MAKRKKASSTTPKHSDQPVLLTGDVQERLESFGVAVPIDQTWEKVACVRSSISGIALTLRVKVADAHDTDGKGGRVPRRVMVTVSRAPSDAL